MSRLTCILLLFSVFLRGADVSGTWLFSVDTNQGSGTPTVVFEQKGEKLSGTFKSQIFGQVALVGTVKGDTIEFGFEGEASGRKVKVSYKGKIEGAAAMKGTAVYAGYDEKATWSAVKK